MVAAQNVAKNVRPIAARTAEASVVQSDAKIGARIAGQNAAQIDGLIAAQPIVKDAETAIVMAAAQNATMIAISAAAPIAMAIAMADIATENIVTDGAITAITAVGIASGGARTTGTIGIIIAGQTATSIAWVTIIRPIAIIATPGSGLASS